MRGARPRREGNFGDPPSHPRRCRRDGGRGAPPPAGPRCLRAASPAEPGFHPARVFHVLQPFPLWETPPNPHTPPPSLPLRAGPRCRGCPAGPAPGNRGVGGGGTDPPSGPSEAAGVGAAHVDVAAHAPPGQPPPSGLSPAPCPSSLRPCGCTRSLSRLRIPTPAKRRAGAEPRITFSLGLVFLKALVIASSVLPSPGSRQGAGGGTPGRAGSARLAGRHPRLGYRQESIPGSWQKQAPALRCAEVSSWDPQNKIKRVRRVEPGTG